MPDPTHPTPLLNNSRWTWGECILALLALAVGGVALLSKVGYSGSWDGDPAHHARHAMEAVNVFAAQWAAGENPVKAFLHCYAFFPKMLHEMLLVVFVLIANGIEQIDYRDIEFYGAWFATVFSIGAAFLMYWGTREFSARPAAIVASLIAVTSCYFLLYANFPRHNMPSHAFAWLAWLLYLYWRSGSHSLTRPQAAVIGLLWGASVPIHYTSAYLIVALVLSESLLLLLDHSRWKQNFNAFVTIGIWALAVPLAIDIYFYLLVYLHPHERDWQGLLIAEKPYSFIKGLLRTLRNIVEQRMVSKLADHDVWFLFGFIKTSFGWLGSLLMLAGVGAAGWQLRVHWRNRDVQKVRLLLILTGTCVTTLLLSLQFFQNARKLAVFYPALTILMALGIAALSQIANRWVSTKHTAAMSAGLAFAIALADLVFRRPAAQEVWEARRDTGFMREYLASADIQQVLTFPQRVASSMAPDQLAATRRIATGRLTVSQVENVEYDVLHRLIQATHGHSLIDCISAFTPEAQFPNQVALPIFYYEFPLDKEFMDFDHPLTRSRSLFRWQPLQAACLQEFIDKDLLIDDRPRKLPTET